MIIPSQVVTCLPTFDAAAVCHLHASSSTPTQSFRLAGKPGGLLYVEQQQQQPQQQQLPAAQTTAALQGWSKWLVQHEHNNNDKASMHILAKPYLQLGFLFGEPEFGLSPEVALPMYLTETTEDNDNNHNTVTIASTEIGKQLACTADGNLYSTSSTTSSSPGVAPPSESVWRCDWQTPEICCIISAAQGLRLSLCEQQQQHDDTRDMDDGYPSVQPTMSLSSGGGGASVQLVQSYESSAGPESTHWRLIEQGDGTVAIVSHNERYVLGDDWQNTVTLSCPEPGPVPRWRVVKTCARGVGLQSVATQRFLQVNAAGRFSTQPQEDHQAKTTTTTSHDATNSDTNAALFWLEPIHGSTFTIQHVKHQKATKNNNKNDLQNVLIKVFDNGNVIIKRDGQFFGECYWQDKFVGVGFANAPYVWNFEPTAAGPIRIVSAASSSSSLSPKRYLSYDGKSFGLGPWEERDTKDVDNENKDDDDDASDKTAKNTKAKTAAVNDNNSPENDKFLWHLKPKNDKITIGMRYGLLPKHIQKQAKKKFVDMHPFRPTLAMAGELHRPFANWRAWPAQQPQEGNIAAVPTIVVNGHEEPVNTQNNGVVTMATPTPAEPPVVAAATTAAAAQETVETPAWVSAPPPPAPVTAPPPPAATTATTTPIVSSPDLILPQPEMELETPVPTAQEIAAFQKSIAEQQAKQQEQFEQQQQQQQQEQAPTLPPQPETPMQQQTPPLQTPPLQETTSSLTPAPDAHIPAEANPPTFSVAETPSQPSPLPANNEQQQQPAQDGEGLRFFDAQEGFNFLKADANNGPQTTPGTQWPENTVNPQEAPPPAVPATRTMNGRPLPADNVTSYGRGGPNYSSSSGGGGEGGEPSGPRIFTVDRT